MRSPCKISLVRKEIKGKHQSLDLRDTHYYRDKNRDSQTSCLAGKLSTVMDAQ